MMTDILTQTYEYENIKLVTPCIAMSFILATTLMVYYSNAYPTKNNTSSNELVTPDNPDPDKKPDKKSKKHVVSFLVFCVLGAILFFIFKSWMGEFFNAGDPELPPWLENPFEVKKRK